MTALVARFSLLERFIMLAGFALAIGSGIAGYASGGPYGERSRSDPRVLRVRDPATGELRLVVFDADGNGRFDTWSYMNSDGLYRMDIDDDGDGRIDRREYYNTDGMLTRTDSPNDGDRRPPSSGHR